MIEMTLLNGSGTSADLLWQFHDFQAFVYYIALSSDVKSNEIDEFKTLNIRKGEDGIYKYW